jgi:hypothetical protein
MGINEAYRIVKEVAKDWKVSASLGLATAEYAVFSSGILDWNVFGDWTQYGIPFRADHVAHLLLGYGASRASRKIYEEIRDNPRSENTVGVLTAGTLGLLKEGADYVMRGPHGFEVIEIGVGLLGAGVDVIPNYISQKMKKNE